MEWRDKHVLVTGGSSGTGLAAAEILAGRGARVSLIARDEGRLSAARTRVEGAVNGSGGRVHSAIADVSDWEQTLAALDSATAEFGPVDVLLACAGYCTPRTFVEASAEELRGQVETNLMGTIHAARAVAPSMIERGSGHILLISSMGGIIGVYGYGGYSPSKFGVIGLAEVLRSELKPHGIGVTVLCPPNIDSPGYAREVAMEPAETAKINGSAKAMSPEAVAARMLRAVEKNEFMVVPGAGNALTSRIKGIAPWLVHAVVDHGIASARKGVRPDVV